MVIFRTLLVALFGLLPGGLLQGAAENRPEASLRVATYNLRNYLVMDRYFDGQWRPAYPKPESEKAAVRRVITAVAPDILILQEIGGAAFLEELRSDLAADGLDYAHSVLTEGPDTERQVAMLSKQAPEAISPHPELAFKYFDGRELVKRGLLEVRFSLPDGTPFVVFGLHLKSRFPDRADDPQSALRRTREAEACRNRIIERTLERGVVHFLVAGDFNDHPNSSTMRRFEQRGDLAISTLVEARDSRGELWTYFYAKEARYELVDALFASPALHGFIVGGQGTIADLPEALEGSDHRMVFLDLK